MLKIEAGKSYRCANGYKIGPMIEYDYKKGTFVEVCGDGRIWYLEGKAFGTEHKGDETLVAEWSDHKSPIREVVKKNIEPGTYGNLTVYYQYGEPEKIDNLRIEVTTSKHTADELRDMAKTLVEIADFMDEQK